MLRLLPAAILTLLISASSAIAERVVLVELYTSQGCSSCPPADEILYDLHETHEDILAISFHVDYWDYLGWKDAFAKPEFTARQAAYNENLKSKYRLVTPQMIFDGRAYVAGGHTIKIFQTFSKAQEGKDLADLSVSTVGDGDAREVSISLSAVEGSQPADVFLVRYAPQRSVKIERGENSGRTLNYLNSVSDWQKIGSWDGASAAEFTASLIGEDHAAIIVQGEGSGPVYAVRKIKD